MRARGCRVPILMLTARDGVADRISGLDAGADDYVVKPFAYEEVSARLRALARRATAGPARDDGAVLASGPIALDETRRRVTVDGRPVELTLREFSLLECLLRHPGHALSRDQLLDMAWPFGVAVTPNTVDAFITFLRRKLGPVARLGSRPSAASATGWSNRERPGRYGRRARPPRPLAAPRLERRHDAGRAGPPRDAHLHRGRQQPRVGGGRAAPPASRHPRATDRPPRCCPADDDPGRPRLQPDRRRRSGPAGGQLRRWVLGGTLAFVVGPNDAAFPDVTQVFKAQLPNTTGVAEARLTGESIELASVDGTPVRILSHRVTIGDQPFVIQVVADRIAEERTLAVLLPSSRSAACWSSRSPLGSAGSTPSGPWSRSATPCAASATSPRTRATSCAPR